MGIVEIFGEFGNAFGVRLGLELEAFALEESFELLVVCNDTIVNDSEFPLDVGSASELAGLRMVLVVLLTDEDGS